MLAFFHTCGTEPTSQALVISWSSLLNRVSRPCFHISAGIPSSPGALPSFWQVIALIWISSRLVLVMHCGMLPSTSWSKTPGTLSSFWKCSLHLSTTLLLSEKVSILYFDFMWTGLFSWVPTLPSVHCRSPSCCFCQQLCAAPLPSFPASLYSAHWCVFVAVYRLLFMLQ